MKRKRAIKYLLGIISFSVVVLLYTSLVITVKENITFNHNFIRKDRTNVDRYQLSKHQIHEEKQSFSRIYRLSSDHRYHYEFRYEFHSSTTDHHRLMLILPGANRACSDLWNFPVGRRTLIALRQFNHSILAICPLRQTYDINLPIIENRDARYIYFSLQIWMNTVYYHRFQRYPLLYIHATSRASRFAGILSRILPIQAQLLFIYPGHREIMLIPSMYEFDLQTRFALDSTFANWFYFDYCSNRTSQHSIDRMFCPFHSNLFYFYPVPPSFFIYLKHDPFQKEISYRYLLEQLKINSKQLGGILLNHTEALQFDILHPMEVNASYMQENFHPWHSQMHLSRLFYEHLINSKKYNASRTFRATCSCSNIDFKYFENLLHITMKWSRRARDEYNDYIRHIDRYHDAFCEELCGDILAKHAMISRNIHRTLLWIDQLDEVRRKFFTEDSLQRPLRIWIYNKSSLFQSSSNFFPNQSKWNHLPREYQMYSPEYFLQDLPTSRVSQPLLADYFLIPSDLMYFYFYHQPSILNDSQFNRLLVRLDENYFQILLTNIRTRFAFWRLVDRVDQQGANHLLPILGGRNMGILSLQTQDLLKNVIQLGFTGIRENVNRKQITSNYQYRNRSVVYRHHYDIILPQLTRLKSNRSHLNVLIEKKKRLFYFAGNLDHSNSFDSARTQLNLFRQNQQINRTKTIENRTFDVISIISGHVQLTEYIQSIESTVFSLCPEGFLPWSPRLYESIQIGAIPLILADNIVLPFERWIDWRSFSVKINVGNLANITNIVDRIEHFHDYLRRKLQNALPYLHAFQWSDEEKHSRYQSSDDVFYYLLLELRCRRLEQWYGLISNTSTSESIKAQQMACENHPNVCPCHDEQRSLAFREYF